MPEETGDFVAVQCRQTLYIDRGGAETQDGPVQRPVRKCAQLTVDVQQHAEVHPLQYSTTVRNTTDSLQLHQQMTEVARTTHMDFHYY